VESSIILPMNSKQATVGKQVSAKYNDKSVGKIVHIINDYYVQVLWNGSTDLSLEPVKFLVNAK
jgi:hypothetical protein